MNSIKAVILDMDGVVVDNHKYHFAAWMTFAQKYNFKLNAEIYRDQFNGKTNADLFEMIFGKRSEAEFKKYADEKEGMYQSLYYPHMVAHKGLIDFLDFSKRKKIKIALGTSAPTQNVNFTIDNLRLRQYFDVIVDGQEVTRGKPDPEIYQRCVLKLGIEPYQGIVFEDSFAGIEAGERAGCKVVAVATSHTASELKAKADKIIHDFTEAKVFLTDK